MSTQGPRFRGWTRSPQTVSPWRLRGIAMARGRSAQFDAAREEVECEPAAAEEVQAEDAVNACAGRERVADDGEVTARYAEGYKVNQWDARGPDDSAGGPDGHMVAALGIATRGDENI